MRKIAAILVLLICPAISWATDPHIRRAQISGKLFAVTVLHGCPTEALVAEVQKKGVQIGADYTEIPEAVNASFCSEVEFHTSHHGPMWGWHGIEEVPYQSFTAQFFGGVVVGLHYRIGE